MIQATDISKKLTLWLNECTIEHVPIVGGKNASLGQMIQNLGPKGINIPGGFATTAFAFREFMADTGLNKTVAGILDGLDHTNVDQLRKAGRACRAAILSKSFPAKLEKEIITCYQQMSLQYGKGEECDVAVRSSATAEDLPNAR